MLDGCIPLKMYCELYKETPEAVDNRIQRGIWKKGKEYHMIKGVKQRWIDLREVSQWVRENSVKA
jgi:hypothetical protein